jgi:hypothetical protein
MFLDIYYAYKLYLSILIHYKRKLNRYSLLNHGLVLPKITITSNNYLKFDSTYYRNNVSFFNTPENTFNYNVNMLNTFNSLRDFHSELHIVPYEKDILSIKENLDKYFYARFEKVFEKELYSISTSSIDIIKDYYFTNATDDDLFNISYLNKKILNNDFLQNIIIVTDRKYKNIYFYNKQKIIN